ncbi:MAG: hypothetical protein M3Y51_11510, partial [Actinomycetota bacterium]|nr:hypothetical protein [Actinomycetota bacterium]
GLRFNAEAYARSWERVYSGLLAVSASSEPDSGFVSTVVADAWSAVEAFHQVGLFAFALNKGLPSPTLQPFLEEFRLVRNDRQHMDERLESGKFEEHPSLGALRWISLDQHGTIGTHMLLPGRFIGKQADAHNPAAGFDVRAPIQRVELMGFRATARLSRSTRAMVTYIGRLEELFEGEWEDLERTRIDFHLALFGEPVPDERVPSGAGEDFADEFGGGPVGGGDGSGVGVEGDADT